MIILLHVLCATFSIAIITYALFKPARRVLQATYVSVMATVGSGVYLVVAMPSQMLHTCMVGVMYLAFSGLGIAYSSRKYQRIQRVASFAE